MASMTSWEPERDESARLPCLATLTPQAATMKDARVEMLTVPEPSPPVPQVSSKASPSAGRRTMRWRMAKAAPTTSSTVSPFMRKAVSKLPAWAWVASPSMMQPTTAAISAADRLRPATTWARASRMPIPGVAAGPVMRPSQGARSCARGPCPPWSGTTRGETARLPPAWFCGAIP